jgi:two-component system, chemotaxis family, CheB/CheR fusion protein
VLLGCCRHQGKLSIEVWDTRIGIPDNQLRAIFDECPQIDNAARERSRGLGLGLSIVHRLGALLGHQVRARSRPGRGSVFSIELNRPFGEGASSSTHQPLSLAEKGNLHAQHIGSILVVEDDPDVRELLEAFLKDEGHEVVTAYDGIRARDLVAGGMVRPDLLRADYNLPNGMSGTAVITLIREEHHHPVPAIIITGDISAKTASKVALQDCVQLNNPVGLKELTQAVQRLLPLSRAAVQARATRPAETLGGRKPPVIFVVDDDDSIRGAIRAVLEDDDREVEDYDNCEAFLAAFYPGRKACLVIDAYLPA